MGIEPFLVSSSVIAVMAQRLVRRVCPSCRESYRPDGRGAAPARPHAPIGSAGRTVYAAAPAATTASRPATAAAPASTSCSSIDDDVRNADHEERRRGRHPPRGDGQGHDTLREDGADKVLAGADHRRGGPARDAGRSRLVFRVPRHSECPRRARRRLLSRGRRDHAGLRVQGSRRDGRTVGGIIDADSPKSARVKLRRTGSFRPTSPRARAGAPPAGASRFGERRLGQRITAAGARR